MLRLAYFSWVVFLAGTSLASAEASCAGAAPGTRQCQVGEVLVCSNGSWITPPSGPERCADPKLMTVRIIDGRADQWYPGKGGEILEKDVTVTSTFASVCDDLAECKFKPLEHYRPNERSYNLTLTYACMNQLGRRQDFPPQLYTDMNQIIRLFCKQGQ
jgi:hypothetical protein